MDHEVSGQDREKVVQDRGFEKRRLGKLGIWKRHNDRKARFADGPADLKIVAELRECVLVVEWEFALGWPAFREEGVGEIGDTADVMGLERGLAEKVWHEGIARHVVSEVGGDL